MCGSMGGDLVEFVGLYMKGKSLMD